MLPGMMPQGGVTSRGPTIIWNAADKAPDITISEGGALANQTASGFDGVRSVALLETLGSKLYLEFDAINRAGIIGLATVSWSVTGAFVGNDVNSWGMQFQSGAKFWHNNSSTDYLGAGDAVGGDIVMLAFDLAAQKMWAGRNGTWHGSGDPAAGTNSMGFATPIPSTGAFLAWSENTAGSGARIRATRNHAVPAGFRFIRGV